VGPRAAVPQAGVRVTNREREPLVQGETTYTFVTDGIERALELAREAASGKEVELAGGGQFAGALQDVELEVTEVVHAPRATHIRYRRVPD
jgi:dihydrofolate reductase